MFPFNDLTNYQLKHMDAPLVLPDDVLGMISALSKPAFEHFQDYNAYVRIFQKEYPELKAKLCAKDQEVVIALRVYLDSHDFLQRSGAIYKVHMACPPPDNLLGLFQYRLTQEELYGNNCYDSWWSCRCHRALLSLVHDEEFNFWDYEVKTPLYEEDDDDYSMRRWRRTHYGWERTEVGWQ